MTYSFGQTPGIIVISRADYDGWSIGMPLAHVGPFPNYEAYQEWANKTWPPYGSRSGLHTTWQSLTAPEEYTG